MIRRARIGLALAFTALALYPKVAGAQDPKVVPEVVPEVADQCSFDPASPEYRDRPDLLLRDAGECWQAAGQADRAIEQWTALIERYPESQLLLDTLYGLAEYLEAIAEYEGAAERYEQFAMLTPKHMRTADALQNAYLFRLGLDQQDAAKRNLAAYERLYRQKDVERAAAIFWAQSDMLDAWKQEREHAEAYLKTYGNKGGIDRALVAEAVIAQIDWRRSCRKPLLLDSCITLERKRGRTPIPGTPPPITPEPAKTGSKKAKPYRPPKRCGDDTHAVITVHARDKKLANTAQERFKKIVKVVNSRYRDLDIPEHDRARVEAFKSAWGMALVYRADVQFEEYLSLTVPEDLDFMVEQWRKDSGVPKWEMKYRDQIMKAEDSKKRVGVFFEQKAKLGHELQSAYFEVKGTGSPYWTLAAATRVATVLQSFADQLYRMEVPRSFTSPAQVNAYCDALADVAEPVQEQAIEAWTYCVERSTEYQYFSEHSRVCEAEMSYLGRQFYPPTYELFGEPGYVSNGLVSVGVLADEGDYVDETVPDEPATPPATPPQ
ncbi:MAG: hypothetical protein HC927_10640 [Deltaproteobacteria bacterium]|nr:hypothetical protein [Deltaproteobacteria bacterium]